MNSKFKLFSRTIWFHSRRLTRNSDPARPLYVLEREWNPPHNICTVKQAYRACPTLQILASLEQTKSKVYTFEISGVVLIGRDDGMSAFISGGWLSSDSGVRGLCFGRARGHGPPRPAAVWPRSNHGPPRSAAGYGIWIGSVSLFILCSL